jgi:hypothetical protein
MSALFDLDDKPDKIDIVISDKPLENSYKVNITYFHCGEIHGVEVELSSGDFVTFATDYDTDRVLETLPDTFYVQVRA